MLSGIAFNAAGCHLPHGLSYAVSALDEATGTCPAIRRARRWCRTAWRSCSAIRRCGAIRRHAQSGAAPALRGDASARRRATPVPMHAGEARSPAGHRPDAHDRDAERPVRARLRRRRSVDALATGAEPQYRDQERAGGTSARRTEEPRSGAAMQYWQPGAVEARKPSSPPRAPAGARSAITPAARPLAGAALAAQRSTPAGARAVWPATPHCGRVDARASA